MSGAKWLSSCFDVSALLCLEAAGLPAADWDVSDISCADDSLVPAFPGLEAAALLAADWDASGTGPADSEDASCFADAPVAAEGSSPCCSVGRIDLMRSAVQSGKLFCSFISPKTCPAHLVLDTAQDAALTPESWDDT